MSAVEMPLWWRGRIVAGAIVDAENYDSLAEHVWRVLPVHRMTDDWGYVYRTRARNPAGKQVTTSLHREVMGLLPGEPGIVHHRNCNPLDNRRSNLVFCEDKRVHAEHHRMDGFRKITWREEPWV